MAEQDDLEQFFQPLLNAQQFTAADVLSVSGLSAGQLKGMLDRNQINLSANHNPGTGRRRMFTGKDILALTVVHAVGKIGFPLRWGNVLAMQVAGEASRLNYGIATERKFGLAFYPAESGEDWAFVPIVNGIAVADLPTAYQVLDVTREITQTMTKLQAIIDEQPVPEYIPPQPPTHHQNDFAPRSNFMKLWEKDEGGFWRYVGLTLDETRILMEDEGVGLDGDDLVYFERKKNRNCDLITELTDRRETARLLACGFGGND